MTVRLCAQTQDLRSSESNAVFTDIRCSIYSAKDRWSYSDRAINNILKRNTHLLSHNNL